MTVFPRMVEMGSWMLFLTRRMQRVKHNLIWREIPTVYDELQRL